MSAFNQTLLTALQQQLAATNFGLAFSEAKALVSFDPACSTMGLDQCIGEAALALVKAARNYRPGVVSRRSKDKVTTVSFCGYACRAIRTEVRRAARRWCRISYSSFASSFDCAS